MSTLSGSILETRENLFHDFWCLFGTLFYFFPSVIIKKKTEPTLSRTRAGLRPGGAFIYRAPEPPEHPSPPEPAAAAARRRRRSRRRRRGSLPPRIQK